jgi:hypothetical protein
VVKRSGVGEGVRAWEMRGGGCRVEEGGRERVREWRYKSVSYIIYR